jgi:16S rRNA (uracil1498-N3)-methyltransferase
MLVLTRQLRLVYQFNMDLFYLPELNQTTGELVFSKEESKHINKVLRKKQGDKVRTTNGKGLEATIELTIVGTNQVHGNIVEAKMHQPLQYQLHIAIAPTKNNSRLEWFLEKATEIGIHQITPLLCAHSVRKTIKHERLEKIIAAALKQSQQFYLPKLNSLTTFDSFVQENANGMIAHCREGIKPSLFSVASGNGNHTILIGPEGDFSEAEIALAIAQNYQPIGLGNQRLRTETAALVACHTIALKAH